MGFDARKPDLRSKEPSTTGYYTGVSIHLTQRSRGDVFDKDSCFVPVLRKTAFRSHWGLTIHTEYCPCAGRKCNLSSCKFNYNREPHRSRLVRHGGSGQGVSDLKELNVLALEHSQGRQRRIIDNLTSSFSQTANK